MTNKDYDLLARVIKGHKGYDNASMCRGAFIVELSETIKSENPYFDKDEFERACGN